MITLIIIINLLAILIAYATYKLSSLKGRNDNQKKKYHKLTYISSIAVIVLSIGIGYLKYKEIKELEKWENKISMRLMESLYQSMNSFFETIQSYSSTKINNINIESFKVLCKGCDLNQETKILKKINPYTYYTLREYLLYTWQKINRQLNEINSASTYIPPKAYELFLRIKETGDPINILSESKNSNTDLEAWHGTFFKIYNLNLELKELMQNIENS